VEADAQRHHGDCAGLHPMVGRYLRFRAFHKPHLVLTGLDFWRCHEFSCLFRWLEGTRPGTVLDVGGGGSLLGRFLEQTWSCRSLLVDLDQGLVCAFRGRWGSVQTAGALGLRAGSADLAVVTSLVHILPGDDDSAAMAEVARTLVPGGTCFVSTTWARHYHETSPDTNPWGLVERWYDRDAMNQRLLGPSGLTPVRTEFFGDAGTAAIAQGWYGSETYHRRWGRRLLGWRQVRLAAAAEKRDSHDPSDACNVCLLLQKPPDASPAPGVLE
jgi:SAM-dependent methyltransferase